MTVFTEGTSGVAFLVMLNRSIAAVSFAEALGAQCQTTWAEQIRGELSGNEHKTLSDNIRAFLTEHVQGSTEAHFDWEGNSDRKGKQMHSYPLLGTWTHPDAAVLRPFTCAIEFDREPPEADWAHFKSCLMKASCHVLSRAYDASLLVFSLRRNGSTPGTYLDPQKDDPYKAKFTSELLTTLRSRGMVIAIVPIV